MKYKNYVLLGILLVVTFFLTLFLSNIYKSKNSTVSEFYEYCNKISSNELDEFITENPDSIIYIANKNNLSYKKEENDIKNEIELKGLKDRLVYIEENALSKKFFDDLNSKYGKSLDQNRLPVLLIIVDKKVIDIIYLDDASNLSEYINEEALND